MYTHFLKRAIDIALSLILLLATSPVMLIVACLVCLDSPGGPFFCQWRVGKGHRLFKLYKFRTMRKGSESLAALLRDEDVFVKQQNDPRVTRVGALLRKWSLDELPQLVNILKGEMSFVGPRPFVLAESNRLPRAALERLNVLPGLTGYAQAEGRGDATLIDRCARDIYYARNLTLRLDMQILIHTIKTALRGEGAY